MIKNMAKTLTLLCAISLLWGCDSQQDAVTVNDESYIEGVHFRQLDKAIELEGAIAPSVIEIFWYGCSHCEKFEPQLQPWLKTLPDNVSFVRSPAIWSPIMLVHASAYYVAQVLKPSHDFHMQLFTRIMALRNSNDVEYHKKQIAQLFTSQGITAEEFERLYLSTQVSEKVVSSSNLMKMANIQSTPTVIIDGKYVLIASAFKSTDEMLAAARTLFDHRTAN